MPSPGPLGAFFDGVAPWYDTMNRRMSVGLDRRWRQRAARRLTQQTVRRVLDVGIGTGDLAIAVARQNVTGVVGIDLSAGMLSLGRDKVIRAGLGQRICFLQGDALQMPFQGETFDAVVSAFVLRNLADLGTALAEMARVVRPGGQLISLEITYPSFRPWRALFQLYFNRLVPLLGRCWTRVAPAYRYLPDSLARFPPPREVLAELAMAGWSNVRAQPLFPGTVMLYTAVR